MDQIARQLAKELVQSFLKTPPAERFIVGIAGVPASGKTTLSKTLCNHANEILRTPEQQGTEDLAIVVGMDGWHFTRAQLDAFPDSKLAHDRRGAHWTFDGEAYVSFVRELRQPIQYASIGSQEQVKIHAPSFSHELKDPTPNATAILPHHRLIIIEGLYMFLAIEPWIEAGRLLDERWWVELTEEEAKNRLVMRHVLTGVAKNLEEAEWRAVENDAPNGRFIKENMLAPTKVITSVEDPALAIVLEAKRT